MDSKTCSWGFSSHLHDQLLCISSAAHEKKKGKLKCFNISASQSK